jgi:hypothetical protein
MNSHGKQGYDTHGSTAAKGGCDNPEPTEPPDCRQKNSGDMISTQTGNPDREINEERQPDLQPDARTDG